MAIKFPLFKPTLTSLTLVLTILQLGSTEYIQLHSYVTSTDEEGTKHKDEENLAHQRAKKTEIHLNSHSMNAPPGGH